MSKDRSGLAAIEPSPVLLLPTGVHVALCPGWDNLPQGYARRPLVLGSPELREEGTMATIKYVEGQIWRVEGFEVKIRYSGPGPVKSRDVRGDRGNVPGYPYKRARPNDDNVSSWIEGRFRKTYSGYQVDVLDGNGKTAHGRTLLRNLRATYP